MREDLGPGEYRRENSQIRDATRGLTAVRDAFILRKTLGTLPTGPLALQLGLNSEYRREWRALQRRGADSALGHLTASRERLIDLPSTESETASAIAGVTRVYRAGRKALRKARHRDDEALHAWRKQANDLLNQSGLLKAVFNAKFKKLNRRAEKLATALGDDHDLSVLTAKLRVFGAPNRALLKKIKKRRSKLQARAFRLGRKLYRQPPKRMEAVIAARLSRSNPM
jgi:CHAD domain-containing protein